MAIKKGNIVQSKLGSVARTDTTKKVFCTVPANSQIIRITAVGAASNSATSATLTIENTPLNTGTTATLGTIDVKTAGIETVGRQATLAGVGQTRVGSPQYISAKYSEVGAATLGGAWTLIVEYI